MKDLPHDYRAWVETDWRGVDTVHVSGTCDTDEKFACLCRMMDYAQGRGRPTEPQQTGDA